jgi:hypothetical protein
LPAQDELPRAKSTRDLLLAPMKPIVKDSRLRNLLIESQERVREPWEDEGDSDEELIRAIEVRPTTLMGLHVLRMVE